MPSWPLKSAGAGMIGYTLHILCFFQPTVLLIKCCPFVTPMQVANVDNLVLDGVMVGRRNDSKSSGPIKTAACE